MRILSVLFVASVAIVLGSRPAVASDCVVPYDTSTDCCDSCCKSNRKNCYGTLCEFDEEFSEHETILFDALPMQSGWTTPVIAITSARCGYRLMSCFPQGSPVACYEDDSNFFHVVTCPGMALHEPQEFQNCSGV
jgi:hypothetical protein